MGNHKYSSESNLKTKIAERIMGLIIRLEQLSRDKEILYWGIQCEQIENL